MLLELHVTVLLPGWQGVGPASVQPLMLPQGKCYLLRAS